MKIQILEILYHEINRLFIAGAKFSQNDPRLSKLVPALQQLGEKAPPLQKLAEYLENLSSCKSDEAAQALLETGTYLYALLNTQTLAEPEADYAPIQQPACTEELPVTKNTYRNIKPIIEALTKSGSGRLEVLTNAYENGLTNDYRLYPLYSKALSDKYSEIVDLVFEKIIPSIGRPMIPFLVEDYDFKGKKADAKRLSLLYQLHYEKIYELASQAMAESSADIQVAAIDALKDDPANEETLLSLTFSKNGDVREAAMAALIKADSEKGKERLLEMLHSVNYYFTIQAAAVCKDKKIADEVFEYIQKVYEDCKKSKGKDDIEKFEELIEALRDREEECVFDLYEKICADKKNSIFSSHMTSKVLIWYFEKTSRIYSPEKHYDTFIGMYKNGALGSGIISSDYFDSDANIAIDKRWIKAFIEKEDVELLCDAAKTGDREAVGGLVRFLEKEIKKKRLQRQYYGPDLCVRTLMDIGCEGLDKIVFDILKECNWDSEYERILNTVNQNAGRIFPKDAVNEYIKKFDTLYKERCIDIYAGLSDSLKKTYAEDIDSSLQMLKGLPDKLKNHYGENKDGT
jgi:hypothetical protein